MIFKDLNDSATLFNSDGMVAYHQPNINPPTNPNPPLPNTTVETSVLTKTLLNVPTRYHLTHDTTFRAPETSRDGEAHLKPQAPDT
jgi:hypothetical protein